MESGNFLSAIGNTKLIKLRKASEKTGCNILGKAEFLNPGGSVKDRAAKAIILDAEKKGLLDPGGVIFWTIGVTTSNGIFSVESIWEPPADLVSLKCICVFFSD